ncbi:hypothetical protein NC651_008322 [Populus alba x Populus x berolinensis]|nr:hypothetical protein NC651_008322 [Populus alba x Populus x berolinensis]
MFLQQAFIWDCNRKSKQAKSSSICDEESKRCEVIRRFRNW